MVWSRQYNKRLQHSLSRLNHHIHPLVDASTGLRRPLQSCLAKGKQVCKAEFPLDNQMIDKALLVCRCIAENSGLPSTGPRSMLGTVLPARNDEWLNAAPRAYAAFSSSIGDLKFPQRLPILKETHEVLIYSATPCYSPGDLRSQTTDLQVGMSVMAGYFGGYTAKMQDIGLKEIRRLSQPGPSTTKSDGKQKSSRSLSILFTSFGTRSRSQRNCAHRGRINSVVFAFG